MKAEIRKIDGAMRIVVDEKPIPANAYITFFADKAHHKDFADIGFKLFSFTIYFSSKTINENSQVPCFGEAIFDSDEPRYDIIDRGFRQILEACPDALIFPRLDTAVPEKWERANPDELCDEGKVEVHRPCFSSDAWLEETKRLIALAVGHMETSDYADHIVGYQIANGNTQEWLPYDNKGCIGKRSREKFSEYCTENNVEPTEANYYGFLSYIVGDRICKLSEFTKSIVNRDILVGAFYGYTFECPQRWNIHHSLEKVLNCDAVDFICSPVSYAFNRDRGLDHACMLPCDSLREHGKLYFAENDTRTHLSKVPFPEIPYFQLPVWAPKKFEDTVEVIKMHYARALTHGYALWWFDMWGGWFDDATYMGMFESFLKITKQSMSKPMHSVSEIAVFVDEKSYKHVKDDAIGMRVSYLSRKALGKIGAPYDAYLACDYERVKDRYKAIIILDPYRTETVDKMIADAKARGVGCLVIDKDNFAITSDELREFCKQSGVFLYSNKDAVVYANASYLFVHTCSEGALDLEIPRGVTAKPLFDAENVENVPFGYGCLFELER